LPKGINKGSF